MNSSLPRHWMVWIDPVAWSTALDVLEGGKNEPLLMTWAERKWPLVVRRPTCGDVENGITLGLPLPPSLRKRRLGFCFPQAAIIKKFPPPLLRHAADCAPLAWADTIHALLSVDPTTCCFGSLAWQFQTGLDYLSETSDMDLLWSISSALEADRLAAQLHELTASAPMRIDGEFVSPMGRAVQWREWAANTAEVLVKTEKDARTCCRQDVFS